MADRQAGRGAGRRHDTGGLASNGSQKSGGTLAASGTPCRGWFPSGWRRESASRPRCTKGRCRSCAASLFLLLAGYGAEFLLRYLLRRSASRSLAQFGPGLDALLRIAPLVVFAIAAIAAFVLAGWPRRLEVAVAPLLIAWIAARLLVAIAAAVFKPAEDGRALEGAYLSRREQRISGTDDSCCLPVPLLSCGPSST